jgi:hypothetical protein
MVTEFETACWQHDAGTMVKVQQLYRAFTCMYSESREVLQSICYAPFILSMMQSENTCKLLQFVGKKQ